MTDNTKMREALLKFGDENPSLDLDFRLHTHGKYLTQEKAIVASRAFKAGAAWQAAQSEPEEKPDFEKLESLGWQIAVCAMCGTHASAIKPVQSVPVVGEPDCYDAGLLNDFGGGNVGWWQDYIRAELDRAHDFYASQWPTTSITQAELDAKDARIRELEEANASLEASYRGSCMMYDATKVELKALRKDAENWRNRHEVSK